MISIQWDWPHLLIHITSSPVQLLQPTQWKQTIKTACALTLYPQTRQIRAGHTVDCYRLPSHSLISPLLLLHTRKRCPLTFGWQECVVTHAHGRKCCLQVRLVSSYFRVAQAFKYLLPTLHQWASCFMITHRNQNIILLLLFLISRGNCSYL